MEGRLPFLAWFCGGGADNPGTEQTQVTVVDNSTSAVIEQDTYTYTLQGMTAGEEIDKYDGDGNIGEQDTVTYAYNANNDRVGETHEVQTQDPNNLGSLIVQSNTITTNLVDNNNPTGYSQIVTQVTRDASSGAIQSDLVFAIGLQVVTQSDISAGGTGNSLFLFYDEHGSARLVLDSTLNVLGTYTYDAYGDPIGFTCPYRKQYPRGSGAGWESAPTGAHHVADDFWMKTCGCDGRFAVSFR